MSRSKRKSPYMGLCADSEKWDKRKNNRRLRKKCKEALKNDKELPNMKEISDIWTMNKDGKFKLDKNDKLMRK